jgi:hypothetical protein
MESAVDIAGIALGSFWLQGQSEQESIDTCVYPFVKYWLAGLLCVRLEWHMLVICWRGSRRGLVLVEI